jgi:mannose-6-phosphate isomerase
MKQAADPQFALQEHVPYAELWLGTHPSGMSMVDVDSSTMSLLDYVRTNRGLHCGNAVPRAAKAPNDDLSFLLKVLSVQTVLSIQAHPDKKLAQRLHATRPKDYKDPNHKPEMAIAISEKVRAMFGFRPVPEIARHLLEYPEFAAILAPSTVQEVHFLQTSPATRAVLLHMFQSYMEADPALVSTQLKLLIDRLKGMTDRNDVQELILQLSEQFPGDCGIFAPLIFNIVELNRGEGLFIDANEPHAYVSGEIVECMACSDNVVRAGLTPKLKDVDTLVHMLTYNTTTPHISTGQVVDACTTR